MGEIWCYALGLILLWVRSYLEVQALGITAADNLTVCGAHPVCKTIIAHLKRHFFLILLFVPLSLSDI